MPQLGEGANRLRSDAARRRRAKRRRRSQSKQLQPRDVRVLAGPRLPSELNGREIATTFASRKSCHNQTSVSGFLRPATLATDRWATRRRHNLLTEKKSSCIRHQRFSRGYAMRHHNDPKHTFLNRRDWGSFASALQSAVAYPSVMEAVKSGRAWFTGSA